MQPYQSFISRNVVNITFSDGASKSVFSDCPRYGLAIEAIKRQASEDELRTLLDGNLYVSKWAVGNFKIENNKVTWLRHPEFEIPEGLARRLIEYASNGYPADSFVKFLDRLLQNPSNRSVETFLSFVEKHGLTITEQGTFMAYKGCNENLKDVHTGTFDNSPGTHHEMPRQLVSDDPAHACHRGFHCGNWAYARDFGARMVLVEVDPKDIVCVPYDCDCQKIRVCAYTVVKETTPDTKMPSFFASGPDGSEDGEADRFPNGKVECQSCGTYCDAEDEYCRGCGERLPETEDDEDGETGRLFCPGCGSSLDVDNNFCPACGLKVK